MAYQEQYVFTVICVDQQASNMITAEAGQWAGRLLSLLLGLNCVH